MKIFIVGKNGQLGQELGKQLGIKNNRLYSYGKEDLDIRNHAKVKKEIEKIKPDILINATALHASLISEKDPRNIFDVNASGVKNLAEVCRDRKIKFITFSTDYVFDGFKGKPYTEKDSPTPVQMFGISKYMGEIMALNYSPDTLVIRTSGLYGGVKGSRSKGNFVLNLTKEAKNKRSMEVSMEQIFSPTYVEDLVGTFINLMSKNPPSGIYHIVNNGYCSWAEFATKIAENMNLDIKIKPVDRKGFWGGIRRPLFAPLDNSKIQKMGIKMPLWEDALSRYCSFLLNS